MQKVKRSNTAVIYFSLSPGKEALQKSFVSGAEFHKNVRIAGLLRDHSKRQIEQSGLPYFVFNEHNQKGDTFGEKIAYAFDAVFRKGYDYVIAVGNDTPRLHSNHIINAANQLENKLSDIVMGPADDGGTWLMGFSRCSFDVESIKNLAWNSNNLLKTIFEKLGNPQKISLLETFEDLDTEEDLRRFLQYTDSLDFLSLLKKNIRAILERFRVEFYTPRESLSRFYLTFHIPSRGPPLTSDYRL